jgi:hypothetical protein
MPFKHAPIIHTMRIRRLIFAALLALAATRLYPQTTESEQTVREKLIGTWTLVSTEEKLRNGSTRPYPDLGPEAKGYLMYTGDGHMCALLMKPNQPKWHDDIYPTDPEKLSAGSGFTSYCGTYTIDAKRHVIVHHPRVSYSPNFIDTNQPRPYRFEADRLVLSDTIPDGEVERWTIIWQKAPPQ